MRKTLSAVAILATLFTCSAIAKEASSEKHAKTSTEFRQALLQLVRSNMGPLGGMAKGQIPYDADAMQKYGLRIQQLGTMLPDYFETDTRKFSVKTDAAEDIWENMNDFNSKAQDMVDAATSLQSVAAEGDEAKFRAAIGAIGSTCKACHDKYKTD
jgi:cytochrome c556